MSMVGRRGWVALGALLVVGGCADESGPHERTDGGTDAIDGHAPLRDAAYVGEDGATGWLELGACELASTGDPCTGDSGEEGVYALRDAGDDMHLVTGPQGASMIVFAARAMDIEPGDPESPYSTDNPLVEIRLFDVDTDDEMALLRSRAAFVAEPGTPGLYQNLSLFVVMEGIVGLDGMDLRAEATLQDNQGRRREGSLPFVARR